MCRLHIFTEYCRITTKCYEDVYYSSFIFTLYLVINASLIHLQYMFLPQVCSVSSATKVSYYLSAWVTPEGLTANPS